MSIEARSVLRFLAFAMLAVAGRLADSGMIWTSLAFAIGTIGLILWSTEP